MKCSAKKFSFICENSHSFDKSPSKLIRNQWCKLCKNTTEKKLYEWLNSKYKEVKSQICYDWCINKTFLPFDFQISNIIIELDGKQHFQQVWNWISPDQTRARDKFKMLKALENNLSIIRIYQPDVYGNTIDWKNILEEKINLCMASPSQKIIYICGNPDMYNPYRDDYPDQ